MNNYLVDLMKKNRKTFYKDTNLFIKNGDEEIEYDIINPELKILGLKTIYFYDELIELIHHMKEKSRLIHVGRILLATYEEVYKIASNSHDPIFTDFIVYIAMAYKISYIYEYVKKNIFSRLAFDVELKSTIQYMSITDEVRNLDIFKLTELLGDEFLYAMDEIGVPYREKEYAFTYAAQLSIAASYLRLLKNDTKFFTDDIQYRTKFNRIISHGFYDIYPSAIYLNGKYQFTFDKKKEKKIEEGLEFLDMAVQENEPYACLYLGDYYKESDPKKSQEYYKKGSELGNPLCTKALLS